SADGHYVYFVLIIAEQKPWEALVEWMASKGLAADLTDSAYQDASFRRDAFPHIQELVEVFASLQDAAGFFHEGQARGLPVGVLYAPEDLYDEPQLASRDFFVTVEH